jgi:hypothetical protein
LRFWLKQTADLAMKGKINVNLPESNIVKLAFPIQGKNCLLTFDSANCPHHLQNVLHREEDFP